VANEAEAFLRGALNPFFSRTDLRNISQNGCRTNPTDFFEWIDHLALSPDDEPMLRRNRFLPLTPARQRSRGEVVYEHARATFTRVLVGLGNKQILLSSRCGRSRSPTSSPA